MHLKFCVFVSSFEKRGCVLLEVNGTCPVSGESGGRDFV